MTVQVQRFCPLCDRSFMEGEAVLRCGGCGVMHHPGCWVTNNGCATPSEHHVTPIAQAYSGGARPPGQAPHPGEGTRVRLQNSPQPEAPIPAFEPLRRQELPQRRAEPTPQPEDDEQDGGPVIGGEAWPPMARPAGQREPRASAAPPRPPRRYQPAESERHTHPRPMPRIYQKRPITSYWYIPAAVALAIVIAFGVIWGADRIFGGGSDKQPASSTPAATSAAGGAATQPPGTASAATASVTTAPARGSGSSTKFAIGDAAIVTGTGDCLNVRVAPGTSNDAIVCLKDGEEVTVSGGPEESGDLQWWKVKTKLGEGWAAEDYLVKK